MQQTSSSLSESDKCL